MSRFVLTLPSNSSMDHFPNNTAARYTTKLVETLELEGAWEVGLLEIASPSSIENVSEDQCYYTIYFKPGNNYTTVKVPAGLYKRENVLVDALHDAQREQLKKLGIMTDDAPLKVTFRPPFASRMGMRVVLSDDVSSLEFSPDLAGILGFDADVKYSGHWSILGQRAVDMYGSLGLLYVYCDLAEYVLVGDTKAPLLRIVDRPSDIKGIEHRIMNPVQYVPLQKKCFDTVTVSIMLDSGTPVPFLAGKTVAVLEFRRAIHSYFSI